MKYFITFIIGVVTGIMLVAVRVAVQSWEEDYNVEEDEY